MKRAPLIFAALALVPLVILGCTKNYITASGSAEKPKFLISPDTLMITDGEPTRSVYMSTDAPGTLTWRVTSKPSWVTVEPDSGTVTQRIQTVRVTAYATGLGAGTHGGRIEFFSTGGIGFVDVYFSVSEHPRAGVSVKALDFPGDETDKNFALTNRGTGILAWSARSDQSWLTVYPPYGYLIAGDSLAIAVHVSRAGLPVGTQNGTITIEGNSEGGPLSIPVSLTIPARSQLEVSPDSLKFDYFVNTRTVKIRNDGNVPLTWTVNPSQPWLTPSAPSGSLASGDSTSVTITVDRSGLATGTYLATVDVSSDASQSASIPVVVRQFLQTMWSLDHNVVDAEFDRPLNRIVTVSSNPNRLNVLDPEGRTLQSVNLSLTPTCVSVRPDGQYAAVGHSGYVSYVNLATPAVERVYAVTCDALDVILASNGWMYVFPLRDQWSNIRCIELATGNETLHTGSSIYAGTVAKLHPSGDYIYGANNGLSPSDFEKYDIRGGTAAYLYDSPYHGDYPFSGDIWISDDGLRLFARSGYVFRASTVRSEDMTYNGQLAGASPVKWLDHSGAANRVFSVSGEGYYYDPQVAGEIRVYDGTYLSLLGTKALPSFLIPDGSGGGTQYQGFGQFVFVNAAGTRLYALVKAKAGSGLQLDWAMAGYDVSAIP